MNFVVAYRISATSTPTVGFLLNASAVMLAMGATGSPVERLAAATAEAQ